MKTTSNKQTCTTNGTQDRIEVLSSQKISNTLHLSHTAQLRPNQLTPQVIEFASHEKEIEAYEIEAELRKASARTYANPTLIR